MAKKNRIHILHAPLQHPKSMTAGNVWKAFEMNPHSMSLTEAHFITKALSNRPAYRLTYDMGEDRRRGGRSSVIATRREFTNLGRISVQGSEEVSDKRFIKYGPERWYNESRFEHPTGNIAHGMVHPNFMAGHQNQPRHPLTKGYRDAIYTAERHMRIAKGDGFKRIMTGDLQLNMRHNARAYYPRRVFNRLGFHFINAYLDWVAWDPKAFNFVTRKTIQNPGDHPWIWVVLEER